MSIEHVVLFVGPDGSGKSTAISSISDIPIVTTEVLTNDLERFAVGRKTASMDYGLIKLSEGEVVRLYGIPGQGHFGSMIRLLEMRATGVVLLLNDGARDPMADLDFFLDKFQGLCRSGAAVVGVTRTDVTAAKEIDRYYHRLWERHHVIPIFEVDARDRAQMIVLLATLVDMVRLRTTELEAK